MGHERTPKNSRRGVTEKSPREPPRARPAHLFWVGASVATGLVLLELIKLAIEPDVEFGASHVLTIAVGTLAAVVGGYLVLRRHARLEGRLGEALHQADTERLQASARAEAILQAAVDGVVVIDERGIIQSVNTAIEQTFGYAADELVGKNVKILMPNPYREEHDSYLANYLRTGRRKIIGIGREVVGRRKGGATFPMDLAVSEVSLESGLSFVGTIRDITERKQTEERLRESEQRFRTMVENLPAGAVYREGDSVLMNRTAEEMIGYTGAEIGTVDEWFERLYGAEALAVRKSYEADRAADFPSNRTVSIRRRDGANRFVEFAGYRFEQGEVWLLQDVTERQRMEEELRHERDFAEGIVQTAPAIVLMLDCAGRIVKMNRYLERLVGYTLREVEGEDWFTTFLPERDHPRIRELFQESLGGTPTRGNVNPIVARSGQEHQIAWYDKPLRDAAGAVTGLLAIGLDVTERRLLEDQLRQAQKMEAVGRLAGGIAHDFNTLLGSITGYSEMMLNRADLSEGASRQVEQIHRSAERGAALTRQLLAFSRRQVLEPSVVDLNRVVTGMTDMLRRLIGEDIEMVHDLTPNLWSVRVDANQIEQVILNLAVNAIDAIDAGGRIAIETRNVGGDVVGAAAAGDTVLLAVRDTGCGMDAKTQHRAFEPFFTTKEQGKGTGLGLATVYGIVTQSGGEITVESQPGEGTRFEIQLPREHAVAVGDPAAPVRIEGGDRGSETVLLVEDDPMFLEMLDELLTRNGYDVIAVNGPTDALELVAERRTPIHLTVSDMVMPGMSGQELAGHLYAQYPEMKLIMMSGYSEEALEDRGVARADTVFLQKPFSTKDLLRAVRALLDAPPTGRSTAATEARAEADAGPDG